MSDKTSKNNLLAFRLEPPHIMLLGFALVILTGALLLKLPISTRIPEGTPFVDCLFTATSAVCVTGLAVLETSAHWTVFGKVVIITLIEIGGLGFMTIGAAIPILIGKKINLHQRVLIKEALNQDKLAGGVRLLKNVLQYSFVTEGIGALFLSTVFIPEFGWFRGIGYSLFHSISAFCNAGFDLMGSSHGAFTSLMYYYNNPIVVLTISGLIILGGIGFTVVQSVKTFKPFRTFSVSSKLAIVTTLFLLAFGTLFILISESGNPLSIAGMPRTDQLQVAFFQSTTARTAGFATVDLGTFRDSTIFVLIILMFIGASPASTGGGIKTTTFAVLMATVFTFLKNDADVTIYKRKVSSENLRKALGVLCLSLTFVLIGTYLLTLTQNPAHFDLTASLFECVSAFATVGLSVGGTPNLDSFGKAVIMLLMYIGRVGTITIMTAIVHKTNIYNVRYPEENVIVG